MVIKKILDLNSKEILVESAKTYDLALKEINLTQRFKYFRRARTLGKIADEINKLKQDLGGEK